jgi:ribonucleoside-diphosphate reductase alpha chain
LLRFLPRFIRKRTGELEKFDEKRILAAIKKAFFAVYPKKQKENERNAARVAELVLQSISEKRLREPTVEQVQDLVEEKIMQAGFANVAKAYIVYRKERAQIRELKKRLGVRDELKVSVNAAAVLRERYLRRDEKGNVVETAAELFHRVANAVAQADRRYGKRLAVQSAEKFYEMMSTFKFLPNSPTLMNAGLPLGQLSACFVIPVEDSLDGIFSAVGWMAKIHQSGGGTGFSFSRLRPKGDIVHSTMGQASGPVSFMRIFDVATDVIKQGGRRRGANMGILRVDHPDILEFISIKHDPGFMTNFNLSVAVTDRFMRALAKNEKYELFNPRTGKVAGELPAGEVFDRLVQNAWETGDPGMIFIDRLNAKNPTRRLGPIESTNPCGEVGLHPFEACNLGSINLHKFVKDKKINWEELGNVIGEAVHFLDNVVTVSKFPLPQIREAVLANRRIGLGVMGFADTLAELGVPYDSNKALEIGEEIMRFIEKKGHEASQKLGRQRGSFPNFKKSLWYEKGYRWMRNATVTTIAPTGTISIIAEASSGIEPFFAISFVRNIMEGIQLFETNKVFEKVARERGFYSKELMEEMAKTGSVQNLKQVPEDVKRIFKNALEISPEWHVKMQAVFQRHVDNAVSKTINLRHDATVEDVRRAYLLAYELGCKGITVFRAGSKPSQVLYAGIEPSLAKGEFVTAQSEFSGFSGSCKGGECHL